MYLLALLILLLNLQPAAGQSRIAGLPARHYLESRGEVYFSFPLPEEPVMRQLANTVSVDRINDKLVYAYANKDEFEAFLEYSLPVSVLIPPGLLFAEKSLSMRSEVDVSDIGSWDFYPTYEAYESMMAQFEEAFPELCRVVSIAETPGQREILFARLGNTAPGVAGKPRAMYTAGIHGDEIAGFNLMLRMIHYLLNNYGTEPFVTMLLDEMEIWICPNENPDGTYTDNNATVMGATRGNSNNIDLNRNYRWVESGYSPDVQPETQAMTGLVDSLGFVLSANIHGGEECVNYPWDYWRSSQRKHADHEWWRWVAHEYADTARFYSPANYMNPLGPSFVNGVTHGGDWYQVQGSRQDYMNYYAGLREMTLELSKDKMLDVEFLDNLWAYNYRSLLNYLHKALLGIHGEVSDGRDGKALVAGIELAGHDKDNSQVFSFLPGGNFHRPVAAGTYKMAVQADGYPVYEYAGLELENYDRLDVHINMAALVFTPPTVAFEPTLPGRPSYLTLVIENPGDELIQVNHAGFRGDGVFNINLPAKSFPEIPARGSQAIMLSFEPPGPGSFSGELVLNISVPYGPDVVIPVYATAIAGAAFLQADSVVLFGSVEPGAYAEKSVSVFNDGNIPMTVSSTLITGEAFQSISDFPLFIEPGGFSNVTLVFAPEDDRDYADTLRFETDALNADKVFVMLRGTGDPTVSAGVPDPAPLPALLFPNPTNGNASLMFHSDLPGTAIARIFSLHGRLMAEKTISLSVGRQLISLDREVKALPSGVYMLQLQTGSHTSKIRFIKIVPSGR